MKKTIIEEKPPCSDLLSRFKIVTEIKLNFGRVRRCVFYTSIKSFVYFYL